MKLLNEVSPIFFQMIMPVDQSPIKLIGLQNFAAFDIAEDRLKAEPKRCYALLTANKIISFNIRTNKRHCNFIVRFSPVLLKIRNLIEECLWLKVALFK